MCDASNARHGATLIQIRSVLFMGGCWSQLRALVALAIRNWLQG
ncbi:hypothetical protein E2C01_088426 [Portunus trituberculatus]|uniref:Uncharacterized protein n=1 Tax=Portunus trituberculatus TaxID=210409 RepID=A0A5B7JAQ9_PORTR|nr:hypothetical protein [Portunus trituberculatus]